MDDKNVGFGPTEFIIFTLFGAFLVKKLKSGFGDREDEILPIEHSASFDWQPIIDASYWLLVVAAVVVAAYLVFLLTRHLYFRPFNNLRNQMDYLQASLNQVKDHFNYTGYESYLKSQQALNEIQKSKV